jgi:predicted nuclease of predicted toxin-antitoxin system
LKLLFDHNISHKLVARVIDVFPDSSQTRLLNLGRTNDPQLWLIAKVHGFVLVTKDRDLAELAVLRGAPPKVIWLRMGNCKTDFIERALRANITAIEDLVHDPEKVVLELFA